MLWKTSVLETLKTPANTSGYVLIELAFHVLRPTPVVHRT